MIPIQNIYYLLCYAWNRLEERDLIEISSDESPDLLNLLTKIFLSGSKTLLKRGLEQQYLLQTETYQGIKGKLDISQSFKRNLFVKGLAVCEYDELSIDILPNQILKTTFVNLYRTEELDIKLRHEIKSILWRMNEVSEIKISEGIFRHINTPKSNILYRFLLNISELIYQNLIPNQIEGRFTFRDFVQNERQMAKVFEEFIRNFYKIEVPEAKVYREDLHWKMAGENAHFLPKMQTDISMKLNGKKLIIDAKYYTQTLQQYYHSEKIHSPHLYQLFAYLKNQEDTQAEGILIYPTIEKSLSLSYTHEGHTIRVETLNLNQDWQGIKADLLAIIRG
ncbi:5-methylcytosine-specific restriction enzyme subunit McrC [Arcicella aurantiaca]|uniref:5-methylcytosine-specific restriction enzyme subunit McrC n=1 Tax=Arcicella aurantiaca TaxID=591202 RepID=A0A316EF66_9BACT|nr:restriction endonuclease [Arcicella aurantiaca]PWK27344.1 5-methylcytosine-specific restriction enzyme subunit McrC [Arcicella aurantiaca]